MADVTIKICDRCKKEIKGPKAIAAYKPIFSHSILSFLAHRKQCYGFLMNSSYVADLCEDCSDKLTRFLNGADLVVEGKATDMGDV